MTRFKVSGVQRFLGHEPGEEFEADLPEDQQARAIARGSIKVASGDEFKGLTRSALNELAATEGVDSPDSLPNIPSVIDAIKTAREGTDEKEQI